ncbi:MAG: hypothetical protein AAB265_03480, partial [candidate division NC10 bacterium]
MSVSAAGLREDGRGWGGAGRLKGAREAEVDEDRAHDGRILDGGDNAQGLRFLSLRPANLTTCSC